MKANHAIIGLALLSLGFGSCVKKEQIRKEQFEPTPPKQTKTAYIRPISPVGDFSRIIYKNIGAEDFEPSPENNVRNNNYQYVKSFFTGSPNSVVKLNYEGKNLVFNKNNCFNHLLNPDSDLIYAGLVPKLSKMTYERMRRELLGENWFN